MKLCVVLGLVGMMVVFTGCDKPAEVKPTAIQQQIYTQDTVQVVQAEKKEVKQGAAKQPAVKQEADKQMKSDKTKKGTKAAKAKKQQTAKKANGQKEAAKSAETAVKK